MNDQDTQPRLGLVGSLIRHAVRGRDPHGQLGLIGSLLMRTFGQPRGALGKFGGRLMARTNRAMNQWVIQLLDVQPEERVLDVGCGPGVGIQRLAEVLSTGWAAGVDASREMLEQARERNAGAVQAGRIDLRQGLADHLPYADETFDKVLTINSLQVWPDPVSGLREIRRVLKVGGKIAVCFTNPAMQPEESVPDLLTAAGFAQVQLHQRDAGVCAVAIKRAG
jgi:ubiquinone/menaquinone biosynthesis C-methylase UbiE